VNILNAQGAQWDCRYIPVNAQGDQLDDDDCFYYHSGRNNVVIAFGTLSSFLT